MLNIGAAAEATGLKTKTIRYYADIGLILPDKRAENGYRLYGKKAIRKLIFVKRARTLGFSLPECRELLSLYEDKKRSSSDVKSIVIQKVSQIQEKMTELEKLNQELSYLADSCKGDERADCPILDSLANDKT